jgi:L-ectoine synthase
MIVRSLQDIRDTEQHIKGDTWESRRFLLKRDGAGFSLHDTIIHAGTESTFWYKNHVEAVYCIEGEGELEDLTNGNSYTIKAGTMYTLDGHEKHHLVATTKMRMVCVFNPPCTGKETHDEDGVYPLLEEEISK